MKIHSALLASFLALTLHAAPPPESGDLLEIAKADFGAVKSHKSTTSLVEENGQTTGIKVEFAADPGFPGVRIPAPPEGWDLSEYTGIVAEITNQGSNPLGVALRVDNKGPGEPYNTEGGKIAPGETKSVTVKFGFSYGGNPAFALDPAAIVGMQVFASKPATDGAFVIRSLKPIKGSAAPATSAAKPPAAGAENTNAPSIGGELVDFTKEINLSAFKFNHAQAAVEDGKIKATFATTTSYPTLHFPIPAGGWNLSAFGGIQVTLTNPGAEPVTAVLRADNAGDWKKSPWNSQSQKIAPGATETIKLVFGEDNGKAAFALDSTRVTAIQVFLAKPKQDTTLLLSDLKAWGSPGASTSKASLSSLADRKTPVTPPDWLGKRPPVEGDWTLTFEDNFDGSAIDAKKWEASNSHFSKFFFYQKEKAGVEGGVLKLGAEKKPVEGREYISGQLTGFGKWAQSYGYFEARVKLPATRGFWPAFWLMPDRDVNGPTDQQSIWNRNSTKWGGMEFDILEHLSEWGPGRHNVAVHWDGYGDMHKAWGDTHVYYGPTPDGWHNFGMLWEPGKLTWFIDGQKKAEWINDRVGSVPCHLLLSLQLGGWATKNIDLSRISETFDVDYVRVWQRPDLAEAATKVDLTIPAKK